MKRLRALVVPAAAALLLSCVGGGEGSTTGTVSVPLCSLQFPGMSSPNPYQLTLNYFPAERTGRSLHFRAQYGGGTAEFTDGLYFQFVNTDEIRRRLAASTERDPTTGEKLLTLQLNEVPSQVSAYLMFHFSCGRTRATQLGRNVSLPAISGTLTIAAIDGGPRDPRRLTDVRNFHIVFDDPRPIGDPAPTRLPPTTPIGHAELTGQFRFEYDRASPAQTFPGGP